VALHDADHARLARDTIVRADTAVDEQRLAHQVAPSFGQRSARSRSSCTFVNRRVTNRERMLARFRVDVGSGGGVDDLNAERTQRVAVVVA
jgi:hypothetical protein